MPKYRVVSGFALGGGIEAGVGDIIELDELVGRVKVQQRYVVPVAVGDEIRASEGPIGDAIEPENADPRGRFTR